MFDETGAAAAKISIHLTPLCQIQHQEWTAIAENAGFILQWHSTDDPFIPISEARHVAESLGEKCEYIEHEKSSHFFKWDVFGNELLEKLMMKLQPAESVEALVVEALVSFEGFASVLIAVYINNCQWGLHGPIEVFSRRCIATYIAGLPICSNLLYHAWGEDIFVDQCMIDGTSAEYPFQLGMCSAVWPYLKQNNCRMLLTCVSPEYIESRICYPTPLTCKPSRPKELGLTRVNEFDVMSEIACGDQPAPCGQTDTTFHPFKNVEKWFACWNFANKYGHGPEDRLASIIVEQAEVMEEMKREEEAAKRKKDEVEEASGKIRQMLDTQS
eukprot:g2526.t1